MRKSENDSRNDHIADQLDILIVEDNLGDAYLIQDMLRSSLLPIRGIFLCDRISEAKQILEKKPIRLVLLDLSLPDSIGINSMLEIKGSTKNIPVVVLTGMHDSGVAFEALRQGAEDYLIKDEINSTHLTKSIEYSIERKKAEREIELKGKQILEAVFNAQESERKSIGEELHDNINQLLATVNLYLDAALNQKDERTSLIQKGKEYVKTAIEEIRKLSGQLVLPRFREFGLKKALEEMTETIRLVAEMQISLDLQQLDGTRLSEEHKIALYRIIQEQLNNIIKYASATRVTIRMVNAGKDVDLLMIDNGKGFITNAPRKGIGINNIISRAELFNGKVDIVSSPGKGCRLNVILGERIKISHEAA